MVKWHSLAPVLGLAAGLAAGSAAAQEEPAPQAGEEEEVDLELVLAVDISFSIDRFEAQTQRDGYIAALTHPSVVEAIQSGFIGKIAVTYVEWADAYYQEQLVPWTVVSDGESAAAFAARLSAQPLSRAYYTSISHAIDFASTLFDDNGYDGMRRVIDVSGDGRHNQGRPLEDARAEVLAKGITINGLPILNDRPQPIGTPTPKQMQLDVYYEENVIGGPGAFIVAAEDFEAFRTAILSKLLREIVEGPRDRALALARLGGRPASNETIAATRK